jgi:hypothetical protein
MIHFPRWAGGSDSLKSVSLLKSRLKISKAPGNVNDCGQIGEKIRPLVRPEK